MNAFQVIFVPLFALAALVSLYRVRQRRNGWLAGLFWAGVWAAGSAAIAFPDLPSSLAHLLGIGRGADLVAYLTVLGLLLVTRFFYNRYRETQNLVTTVARHLAVQGAARGPTQES